MTRTVRHTILLPLQGVLDHLAVGRGQPTQFIHGAWGTEPAVVLGSDGNGTTHREPPTGHDGIEHRISAVEIGRRQRLAGADGGEEAIDDSIDDEIDGRIDGRKNVRNSAGRHGIGHDCDDADTDLQGPCRDSNALRAWLERSTFLTWQV